MTRRILLTAGATFVAAWAVALSCGALAASAKPILMPTLTREIHAQLIAKG